MIPDRGNGVRWHGVTNVIPALRPAAKLPHCNVAHCLASSLCLYLSLFLSGGIVLWPLYGLDEAARNDAPAAAVVAFPSSPFT